MSAFLDHEEDLESLFYKNLKWQQKKQKTTTNFLKVVSAIFSYTCG